MKSNKIGTAFIVTVLALAGIGISYAGLTDTITVYGTVTTGTVDLEIVESLYSGTWVWKVYPHGIDITNDPTTTYTEDEGELVAYAKGRNPVYTGPDQDPYKEDGSEYDAVLEFHNLFPCIDFTADIVFHYDGSIPCKVTEIDWDWIGDKIDIGDGKDGGTDFIQYLRDLWFTSGGEYGMTGGFYRCDENGNILVPLQEVVVGTQLHKCNYFKLEVTIHLPQNNIFQGLEGSGYVNIEVMQWNDECNGDITDDKVVNLPDFPVTMKVYGPFPSGWPSYIKSVISGIGPEGTGDADGPYNVWDGNWLGWCVDEDHTVNTNTPYTVYLYSSYDQNMPNECKDPDWPYVNWIINNKGDATPQQIQKAIWYFINGGWAPYGNPSHPDYDQVIQDLIDGAKNNPEGDNYVPDLGEWIAVICWIDASHQITFIEVDP